MHRQITSLRIVASLGAIAVVGAACAELPAITENQCGNRIVDTAEDCDTFAPSGSSCRAPGKEGACQFDCTGKNICPPTFTCGAVDKICRQATGTYDVANAQTLFAPTTSLTFADFDSDGREDALTSGLNDVRIHYFDNRLSLAKTLLLPIYNPKYHVGSVGNDIASDLTIFRTTGLIDVFRGQTDRTLAPVVYSSFPIPNTNISGRAFIVRNQISNVTGNPAQRPTGDDILAFGSSDKGVGVVLDLAGRDPAGSAGVASNETVALPDGTVDKLAGAVAVGSYIEGSVCDQFAIGFLGDDKVDLYTPCRPLPAAPPEPPSKSYELNTVDTKYVNPTRISLPIGATVGATEGAVGTATAGAFALDANGDGHVDLVIVGTAAAGTQIYIAYGIGDGTFSSSPSLVPVDNLANPFAPANVELAFLVANQAKSTLPLAIADLNHDNILDFVFPGGIYISEGLSFSDGGPSGARYVAAALDPNDVLWTSAVIADVNRDGFPDVAATNPTGSIDFFLGSGGEATSYLSYGLDGIPTNLVVGDFDGDHVNDLAFSVSGVAAEDAGASSNEIEVLFGQSQTFPAQPASLGTSPSVVALVAGPLAAQYTGQTAPTDANISSMVALTVDSSSNEYAAILVGNTARIITSSFSLSPPGGERGFVVRGNIGPMRVAKQDDLMLLARDAPTAAAAMNYSLWYAPAIGEATMSSGNLMQAAQNLPSNYGWEAAAISTAGVDSSGIESTLLIAPPPAKSTGQPQMFVVDSKALTLGPAIPIPCNYASVSAVVQLQLHAADFDGDGFRDLLVSCPDATSGRTVVVMFWGDGTTAYLASRMSNVPVPTDALTGVTYERLGPVATRAVVLLTANGLFSTTPGGSDGRTFGPLVQDPTLPGGSEINEGDIDGDGVLDFGIVDVTQTQVQFFRGIPVNDSESVP